MRLIDADAIEYKILYRENWLKDTGINAQGAWKSDIDKMPTIEAEPVVHCKDCKYFGEADNDEPEYHECKYFSDWSTAHYMLENDYCSCAERKDEVKEWT